MFSPKSAPFHTAWILLLLMGGLLPHPLVAQDTRPSVVPSLVLEPGDELRVSSSTYTGRAVYLAGRRDTLVLQPKFREQAIPVPIDALKSLERRRRVSRFRRALEGAMWGVIGGAGVGTLGIVLAERGPGDPPQAWWPLVGAAYFTGPTALVMAVVPAYEWDVLPLPPDAELRLTACPNGLSLHLRF